MVSRRPDLCHTGGEALGDLFYLSTERITSYETTAACSAFSPDLWSCVCNPIPRITSQWLWLDVMILFVIRCEPSSQWQKWQCLVFCFQPILLLHVCDASHKTLFVFASHHCSPLLGHPKVFYLWTLWHCDCLKPPNISVSTFSAETLLRRRDRNCICCLATAAYWTFYQEVLRSTGSVSLVHRHNSL